ncbi:MAG TPA: metallophosphoesterase [Longimicrobium sp.]|nr:metallophosphoesterase [Longimicrobium sp.]
MAATIEAHQEIILRDGYVWWGWWNKRSEHIPRHTFAHFHELIEAGGPLDIFLVDSGTNRLYRARLGLVQSSPSEAGIPCPEPGRTPAYYREAAYKAWFRLESIEEAAPAELRNWSYAEVSEFTDDPYADRFDGKRVFDIGEMLGRTHRTIYFLQSYREGHRDHVVELLPPVMPANFITSPILTRSNYVLHLSDPHFGEGHHQFALPGAEAPGREPLSTALVRDLKAQFGEDPPAAVILNGDFTWQGTREEYGWALELIRHLRSVYDLSPQQLLMVPGNHDIQWGTEGAEGYDRSRSVAASSEDATRNYREFYRQVFGLVPEGALCMGRRIVLKNFVSMDIVGVNSSLLEQKHFAGYGFVSLPQLEHAAERMGWVGAERATRYRLLVLHHHLVPVTAQEDLEYNRTYSLTLDAAQIVNRAMELGVDLALHGHMHQPFAASISRGGRDTDFPARRTLAIHGAGSAGVKRDHTGAIGKNSYSVLEFDEDGATLFIRATGESASRFTADWTCRMERNSAGGFHLDMITRETAKGSG